MANFCELFNKPPDSIKDGGIYDQLHKKGVAPLNYFDDMFSFSESDATSLVGSVFLCPFPL